MSKTFLYTKPDSNTISKQEITKYIPGCFYYYSRGNLRLYANQVEDLSTYNTYILIEEFDKLHNKSRVDHCIDLASIVVSRPRSLLCKDQFMFCMEVINSILNGDSEGLKLSDFPSFYALAIVKSDKLVGPTGKPKLYDIELMNQYVSDGQPEFSQMAREILDQEEIAADNIVVAKTLEKAIDYMKR